MRARLVMMVVVALGLAHLCAPPCGAKASIAGQWVGTYQLGKDWTFIKAQFDTQQEELYGTIDIYENLLAGEKGQTLKELSAKPPLIHFEVPRESGMLVFDGQCKASLCSGHAQLGQTRGTFQLRRVAELDSKIYAQYIGTYQLGPNRYVAIWPLGDDFGWNQLGFLDLGTGCIRALFPGSQTTFFAGPALWIPYPTEDRITFIKNRQGEVTGLTYRQEQEPGRLASRVNLVRENVTFRNGEVTLAGSLVMPSTKGPHPAVVLVHGSGAIGRNYYRYYADSFALRGIAVLSYDKRGVGESTGDWHAAALAILADDALAGVRFLQARKDINSKQIGLWGSSQGGWIAPLAASRSKEVAFVISRVGPGVSPAEQALQNVEHSLRAAGFLEDEITQAVALAKLKNSFARSGDEWEEYKATRDKARHQRWFPFVGGPDSKDSPEWLWERVNNDFNPVPVWEKVTCPVLALFGEKDTIVPPVKENLSHISEALSAAGNKDYTIKIIPGADHLFWIAPPGGVRAWPQVKRFATEAIDTMTAWILKHVDVAK